MPQQDTVEHKKQSDLVGDLIASIVEQVDAPAHPEQPPAPPKSQHHDATVSRVQHQARTGRFNNMFGCGLTVNCGFSNLFGLKDKIDKERKKHDKGHNLLAERAEPIPSVLEDREIEQFEEELHTNFIRQLLDPTVTMSPAEKEAILSVMDGDEDLISSLEAAAASSSSLGLYFFSTSGDGLNARGVAPQWHIASHDSATSAGPLVRRNHDLRPAEIASVAIGGVLVLLVVMAVVCTACGSLSKRRRTRSGNNSGAARALDSFDTTRAERGEGGGDLNNAMPGQPIPPPYRTPTLPPPIAIPVSCKATISAENTYLNVSPDDFELAAIRNGYRKSSYGDHSNGSSTAQGVSEK